VHPLWTPRVRRCARDLVGAGLDLLLPPVCPACGDAARGLCQPCHRQLSRRPELGCVRCGDPVLATARCGRRHDDLRRVSQLVAPLRFVGTGGRLVRRFKLDGDATAGRLLAREMADAWRVAGRMPRPLLVPVPLHRARLRRRGFDQARWLASGIAERLRLRALAGVLARVRATRPQGDPLVRSRADNVRGAFAVRRPKAIRGRDVLLVDDVFTTGATARACAGILREAGARSVSLLVACRS
jgi:ComF family protein